MIDEKYKNLVDYLENGIDAIKRCGITVLECRDRALKLQLPLALNTNHLGIMYGGSLLTVAEMSGGAIFGVSFDYIKYIPLVKEVSMKFKKPALSDVTLEVSVTAEKVEEMQKELDEKGKSNFTMEMELKDQNDQVVALVTGIYQVRDIPEGLTSPLAKYETA
ncbi:MAG: DUF4442 domain-containing protein [bacterium]|nr:DUF4442 domain-containing protein [bacterium]